LKRYSTMNHIFRVFWCKLRNAWVDVAETALKRGEKSVCKLVAVTLSLMVVVANAAPLGGEVVSGAGSISQSSSTTTIQQSSQNLSLNWESFNIAPQEAVNFQQPSSSAIAVNRIFDTNGTQILGQLNANGQVYLINPNGILFGQCAQVNVGGLVASTLDLNIGSLDGNTRTFSGNGTGSIINLGNMNAADGGYLALLGNHVSNHGTMTAYLGSVALGAGSAATLTFSGNSLVHMQVDQSILISLAENGGLIRADGGTVIMTAGSKNTLLASVVNNTGVIEARTVENRDGVITLLGGMEAGTVNVGGTLDASAASGGNGGFVETSAAHVKVAHDAKVTTAASVGLTGNWLIDPQDYTVAASSGDITGADLSASLGTTNVEVQSSAGGSSGSGNVNVNDAVSWNANNSLTLTAANDVNINADITATGDTAGLVIKPNTANGGDLASTTGVFNLHGASITLSGSSPSLSIAGATYTVINDLGAEGSTTATDLQGMNNSLSLGLGTNYALGSNIDASATFGWNGGAGFTPIGSLTTSFTGTFDGLGHTISTLTINLATPNVGLFGVTGTGAVIQNVGLVDASVTGGAGTGALVGNNGIGASISNSFSSGIVFGAAGTGGLVGSNTTGSISNSYSTSSVTGGAGSGGLVGSNTSGAISNSFATGSVSGAAGTGGLMGSSTTGTISNSYATGNVSNGGASTGGLIGSNTTGAISNSYATGDVTGGGADIGGLIGTNTTGPVTESYAAGLVGGSGSGFGGLLGSTTGLVIRSFWDITTTNQLSSAGGGTGMTTVDMQTQAKFDPTWDFTSTWMMYGGHTYPLLQSFMTPLTVTANNDTPAYNGVAYSGGNGVTPTPGNLLGTVSYSGTSQGAINAGSYVITPSGLYSNQQGYIISYADGMLTITPRIVTIVGTVANDKLYDGNTLATLFNIGTVNTGVGTETLMLNGPLAANFNDPNVLTADTVTASGYSIANGTGLASNYALTSTSTTATANITPRDVTIAGTVANDKVYDGDTLATLFNIGAVTTGVGSETLVLNGPLAANINFNDPNVLTADTVTASGYSLANDTALASNYALSSTSATATANITPRDVSITGTVANDKVYDGNTLATLFNIGAVSTGVGTQTLVLNGPLSANINFNDPNVLTANTVTASGYSIADGTGLASNYALTSTSTTATANITHVV
jgi:filamentous hemagglutinin family protein